ncbi:DUF2752 domain-containing protein [Gordonia sp. LUNF6]|uniref:DUF2752 domain-containing protein n=1 Tax=Gordonia TaxID=2053 RepID=UPI0024176851|nr:DUF2752 domain-containing protein [Gordonia sihwensis]WFN92197.1 DUF2752 domain-containing protein [Gordonia sihwensis]
MTRIDTDSATSTPAHRWASTVVRHRVYTPLAALTGAAAVCVAVWFGDPTTPGGYLPPCPTKLLLHIDCPGCGSTRALYCLLHGDIPAALHYNAVGVLAFVLIAAAFVSYTIGLWKGRRIRSWQHWRYAPVVTLVVVAAWFVVRNIPIAPFDSLKV